MIYLKRIFCSLDQVRFLSLSLSESALIFLISTTCFFGGMMAFFYINVFLIARENRVKSAVHLTVSGWSLTMLAGRRTTSYGAWSGIGRCPIYIRRPAPVRYVTRQEKILKNRPVPGRLSNSPVICKSLKSYYVSFICDHSITRL